MINIKRKSNSLKKFFVSCAVVSALFISSQAFASGGIEIPKHKWPHSGMTGSYDQQALKNGFQVYKEVCSACHGMKFLSYRHLIDIGFTPSEVKEIAAEYSVTDGPNDEGDMFERVARPSDRFKAPFANDQAARAANNGALPPDLSLVVKARVGGEDYIHALLTGYGDAPKGTELMDGMAYNKYFPGHQIAMAPPLSDGQITYKDGTEASLERAAEDVTQFLTWASEPQMDDRKRMGWKVLFFLFAWALIMYMVKKQVWSYKR